MPPIRPTRGVYATKMIARPELGPAMTSAITIRELYEKEILAEPEPGGADSRHFREGALAFKDYMRLIADLDEDGAMNHVDAVNKDDGSGGSGTCDGPCGPLAPPQLQVLKALKALQAPQAPQALQAQQALQAPPALQAPKAAALKAPQPLKAPGAPKAPTPVHRAPTTTKPRRETPQSRRRQVRKFSPWQLEEMENVFQEIQYPDASTRRQLARVIHVTDARVKVWFQNRRVKHRRIMMRIMNGCVESDDSDN